MRNSSIYSTNDIYWTKTSDDINIRFAAYRPSVPSLGTVFIFPGRTEYIEKYSRTINRFLKARYSTVILDWRGHGASDRLCSDNLVSHVDSFADYQHDVRSVVDAANKLEMPKPHFIYGHSMGALIALRAIRNDMNVKASVFSAPMWGIQLTPYQRGLLWALASGCKTLGLGCRFAPGAKAQQTDCYVLSTKFPDNRLTTSAEKYAEMQAQAKALPHLQTGGPSMQWVLEALKECRIQSKLPSPDHPTLTVYGDSDVLIDSTSIKKRMSTWPKSSTIVLNNTKHDPTWHDADVLSEIISWFDQTKD